MRFDLIRSVALAATFAAPFAASAQYNQGVQPYNPQDPQNYGAPAQQNYGAQYQQQYQQQAQPQYQQQYGQQPQYASPDGQYGQQQAYPQGGQEQIYQAPPALPTYDQPLAPGDGYIWTPGYWAWGPGGYYWVPGAWVLAPYEDALWTPGYWGYGLSGYFWNAGYWGPEVGYYGGINYGFGYFGIGFCGGYWRDHRFWYNREYTHIGGFNHNVYSERFNGIRDMHPSGRSFTTAVAARGNEFRGGSYNGAGRSFAASPTTNAGRGFAGAGQATIGRPAVPGSTYSNVGRGYSAPVQRSYQPAEAPRAQGFSGGGYTQQRMAPAQSFSQPAQQHYSAPSAPQHYSAPSAPRSAAPSGGGGSFHGGGGGGGSHGGGGGRR